MHRKIKDAHEWSVKLIRMPKQLSLSAMARTSLTLDAELPENMPAFELGRNIIINDEQDWA